MDYSAPAVPVPELPPDSWRENVAAIVLDATGRVLLGLGTGRNAYWHFPQGGVGGSETLEAALHRELQEEAGLEPSRYRIITSYGGLRYRYRKGNEKSGRWRGQEQTWFLVHCHEEMPDADCSQTDEFCAFTWVPWWQLSSELFAPFKRKVVEKVLATFFPPHLTEREPIAHALETLTPRRYRLAGRSLAACAADDRALFGGGKEEMSHTLARMTLHLRAAHKAMTAAGSKLLVLLHGDELSGRKQCLRRLSASLDPLRLRAAEADIFSPGLPWELLQALPPAGGLSLVIHRAGADSAPEGWHHCEQWLMGQGIAVLKLYLHTGGHQEATELLTASDSEAVPWYVIPSERRWYRDYVVASLLASSLSGCLSE